jgi:uncharacterized protein (TIGR03435 family)
MKRIRILLPDDRAVARQGFKMIAVIWLCGLTMLNASAQSVVPSKPKFEVASIKRCKNDESPSGGEPTPGRLDLACVTTANLIRLAYLIFPTGQANGPVSPSTFQIAIAGGPSWADSDRYRIDAKAGQPVNVEMMKGPMMQTLLEDRFKLKLHREAKANNVYELTVAKDGAKLKPAREDGCVVFDRNHPPIQTSGQPHPILCGSVRANAGGGVDILGVTMPDLCRQLSAHVDREILDKTGVKGIFDVHLDLSLADLVSSGAAPDSSSPSVADDGGAIASAVKKLGLQMRSGRSTGEILVIDYVERPSEN